jgi:ADP-heptose:LPS heptosyltransferase
MGPTDLQKVLLIRIDRIGDLVLSLPVDQALPDSTQVDWWIPHGLSFITDNSVPARSAQEVTLSIGLLSFFKLWQDLRRKSYSAAVVFHAPWWVSALLWLARIPKRAGVLSQWHSYLFLNRGLRQKRSQVQMHELDYNFELLTKGLDLPHSPTPESSFKDSSGLVLKAPPLLPSSQLAPLLAARSPYYVVHVGMGGSALNWPTEKYVEVIEKLKLKGSVVLTGTKIDSIYLAPIKDKFKSDQNVLFLDGKLSGTELLQVLAGSFGVVAPSTGVLHLAASLQVPTLGIFSPVLVQSLKRWGPIGSQAQALAPAIECPGRMACLGPSCPYFNCMTSLASEQALGLWSADPVARR